MEEEKSVNAWSWKKKGQRSWVGPGSEMQNARNTEWYSANLNKEEGVMGQIGLSFWDPNRISPSTHQSPVTQ